MTRLGVHFLFVGTFALMGGALRGFNLLLILAGLVFGILLMHWRWSRRSLEDLMVSRRLPSEAYAGKPFRVGYLIHSNSRFLPVWMLRVEDNIASRFEADRSGGKWSRWGRKMSGDAKAVCGVGVVSPGKTKSAQFDCTISRRGVYKLGPTKLVSCFPLSLMTACKVFVATETLHVYPALIPLKATWSRNLASFIGGGATSAKRNDGGGGEFFGLREWQSGDSTQWIHWRTTARTGVPAVRQFEQRRNFDVCLLIDAFGGTHRTSEDASVDEDPAFEQAVSLAASLLCRIPKMMSNRFVLGVAASEACAVQCNGQREGAELSKRQMLQLLAVTESVESPKLCETIQAMLQLVGRSQELVVISTRSMNDAVLSDPDLDKFLMGWNRQNVLRWINVQSSDIDQFVAGDRFLKSHAGVAK